MPERKPKKTSKGNAAQAKTIENLEALNRELLEMQLRQQALLDNIPDLAWLKDQESRFIAVNQSFAKACGVPASDLAGKTDLDIWPHDLAESYRRDDSEVMALGKTKRVVEPLAGKDGRRAWIETIKTPIFGEDGGVIGTAGIARDVTLRKEAEELLRASHEKLEALVRERTAELSQKNLDLLARIRENAAHVTALRESEQRYRVVADNTYDWEYWIGPDARFLYCSPSCERITGHTREEFEADPELFLRTIAPEDRKAYLDHREEALKRALPGKLDLRVLHRDGSRRWIQHVCYPIFDREGRHLGARGTNRDVTEQKLVEDQLRQSQKMEAVGRLAGGVAHDFNNVLSAIFSFSEMALEVPGIPPKALSHLTEILQAAHRAAKLTRQLLAFSRKQVLQPKVLDLNGTISAMGGMLARLIGENIRLEFRPGENPRQVKVDLAQLEQAIVNLAVNARDAMSSGGCLLLETRNVCLDDLYCADHGEVSPGDHVMLAVSDTGAGMGREVQERIFEPFFTTKEQGKGTGLGLSMVYGFVKQSGGSIQVYSEVGRGTTFKMYLPATREEGEAATHAAAKAAIAGGREHVLLAEDEPQVREAATMVLEHLGYRVSAAEGVEAAKELFRKSLDGRGASPGNRPVPPVDLLLTDMVMPDGGGMDLYRALEEMKPGLKAVFMSGYTDDFVTGGGNKEAELPFLQKPFSSAILAAKLREVLDG